MAGDRKLRYDRDIAKAIDTAPSTLSQYRSGHNMSVLVAMKLAELLGINPLEVICATMAWQAKNEDERTFWEERYHRYKEA